MRFDVSEAIKIQITAFWILTGHCNNEDRGITFLGILCTHRLGCNTLWLLRSPLLVTSVSAAKRSILNTAYNGKVHF